MLNSLYDHFLWNIETQVRSDQKDPKGLKDL